jgi:hypothetical protein
MGKPSVTSPKTSRQQEHEKMMDITKHRGNTSQNHRRNHFISIRTLPPGNPRK